MLSRKKLTSIFIIFIIFGIYCSFVVGISYDEFFHIENGEKRLKYLFSLGFYDYSSILHLKYYPGLYDTLSSLIVSAFPKTFKYEFYHIINFLVGISGLFALKKFVKILFNKKISDIFFILSLFTPLYFGHLGINPKDTIIASANFWILYYVFKYFNNNTDTEKSLISNKLGLLIGFGAGVRIMFLGTLIPIIIIFLFEIFFFKKIVNKINVKRMIIDFLKIIFISYFLIIICWPDVHQNIFLNPFILFSESLKDFSQGVQVSYFAGFFYETKNTPWSYILSNFFYKIPVFFLLSFFLSFFFFLHMRNHFTLYNKNYSYFYFISLSLLLIPILIAIFLKLKIHDGIRYFIYLIPLFNIIPSLFLNYLITNKNILVNKLMLFFLSPFLLYFIISFVLITPYQYSYLNLFNKYLMKPNSFENDYWGVSLKELIKNFVKIDDIKHNPKIAFCGINVHVLDYYLKKYGIKNYIKADMNKEFDYAILINRAISAHDNNGVKNQTCFQKFGNKENLYILSKNSIVLSKIIKY